MEKDGGGGAAVIIFIIAVVWIWSLYSQIGKLKDALDQANYNIMAANDTIDQLNSSIEDAKGYAWGNYYDMGNALDGLETGDTVSTVPVP